MNIPKPVHEARAALFDAAIDQRWEPDFYCSDGSGGLLTQYPTLRRCANAVVRLNQQSIQGVGFVHRTCGL